MSRPKISQSYTFYGGFVSDTSVGASLVKDAIVPPSRNVVYSRSGVLETFAGCVPYGDVAGTSTWRVITIGATIRFPFGFDVGAGLGKREAAGFQGRGSAFFYSGTSLFFIGRGPLIWNGRDTLADVSHYLKYITRNSYDSYSTSFGSEVFTVGLAAPTDPPVTDTAAGDMTGSYSYKFTYVRPIPASGIISESNPSPATPALELNNNSVVLGFPPLGTNVAINIYGTLRGFGRTGPWYYLKTVEADDLSTIGSISNAIQLNYNDGEMDLSRIPPVDAFPPPPGLFGMAIRDVILIVGIGTPNNPGGGSPTVICSAPGRPEAYPPTNVLTLPEWPTGVLTDASSGLGFIACQSSLHMVTYTGTQFGPPVDILQIWGNIGVSHETAMALCGGSIYAFTRWGACRSGQNGEPDMSFATPVRAFLSRWDERTTHVGYDPSDNAVVYANGNEAIIYYIDKNIWSSPIYLRDFIGLGSVRSFHTLKNQLFFEYWTRQSNALIEGVQYAEVTDGPQQPPYYMTFLWNRNPGLSITVEAPSEIAPCGASVGSFVPPRNWSVYSDFMFADVLQPKTIDTAHLIGHANFIDYGLCTDAYADREKLAEEFTEMHIRLLGGNPIPAWITGMIDAFVFTLLGGMNLISLAQKACANLLFNGTSYPYGTVSKEQLIIDAYRALVGAELPWHLYQQYIDAGLNTRTKDEIVEFFLDLPPCKARFEYLAQHFLRNRTAPFSFQGKMPLFRFDRVINKINVKNVMSIQGFIRGNNYSRIGGIFVKGETVNRRISEPVETAPTSVSGEFFTNWNGIGTVVYWNIPGAEYVIIWHVQRNYIVHVSRFPSNAILLPFPAGTAFRIEAYIANRRVFQATDGSGGGCPFGAFTFGGSFTAGFGDGEGDGGGVGT